MKRGEREAFTIYIHSPKGPLLTTVPVDKAQQVDNHGYENEVGGRVIIHTTRLPEWKLRTGFMSEIFIKFDVSNGISFISSLHFFQIHQILVTEAKH